MDRRKRWLTGPDKPLHSTGSVLLSVIFWLVYLRATGRSTWWQILAILLFGTAAYFILPWVLLGLVYVFGSLIVRRPPDKAEFPCPVCGYDVRATLNRCPECGTELQWGQLPDPPKE